MRTQKMSLANIQGKLSRAEMKNIMAGFDDGSKCNDPCTDHCTQDCRGQPTQGNCAINANTHKCNCDVVC